MRRRGVLIGLGMAALVVASCGSGGDAVTVATLPPTSAPVDASVADTVADRGPRIDPSVFDTTAPSIVDGSPVDLTQYAGTDLIVWFWSPW